MHEANNAPNSAAADVRMRAFINEIEAEYDGAEVELSMCRDVGRYTLRVRTPHHVHFADATESQWREILGKAAAAVKDDVVCPFCSETLAKEEALGMGRCPACGSHASTEAEALLNRVLNRSLRPSQILWLLSRFESWIRIDELHHLIWIRLPRPLPDEPLGDGIVDMADPALPNAVDWMMVRPLIALKELSDDEATEVRHAKSADAIATALDHDGQGALVLPSCQHCMHSIAVPGSASMKDRRCAYPHFGFMVRSNLAKVLDPRPLAFKPERGDQTPLAIVWNRLLEQLLQRLVPVDAQALEAYYGAPYDAFGGPICPGFLLNAPAAKAASLTAPAVNVPVQFNLTNLDRRRQQTEEAARQNLLRQAQKTIGEYRGCWHLANLFSGELDDLEMDQLAALAWEKFPTELVKGGEVFRSLRKHFNLRHDTADDLDRMLQALAAFSSIDIAKLMASLDLDVE